MISHGGTSHTSIDLKLMIAQRRVTRVAGTSWPLLLTVTLWACAFGHAVAALAMPFTISEKYAFGDPLPGSDDSFAWSVDIDGDIAVVGMPGSIDGSGPAQAAFVYHVPSGELLRTLVPSNPQQAEGFGTAVAISGNLVVVGARSERIQRPQGTNFNAGAAHVFDLNTGEEISRLVANEPSRLLGEAVAINGNLGRSSESWPLFAGVRRQVCR
jgi:hypothetical protein